MPVKSRKERKFRPEVILPRSTRYPFCFSITVSVKMNTRIMQECNKRDMDKTALSRIAFDTLFEKIDKGTW
jgi:hypothetical protein